MLPTAYEDQLWVMEGSPDTDRVREGRVIKLVGRQRRILGRVVRVVLIRDEYAVPTVLGDVTQDLPFDG
jgi:hypothetical protein